MGCVAPCILSAQQRNSALDRLSNPASCGCRGGGLYQWGVYLVARSQSRFFCRQAARHSGCRRGARRDLPRTGCIFCGCHCFRTPRGCDSKEPAPDRSLIFPCSPPAIYPLTRYRSPRLLGSKKTLHVVMRSEQQTCESWMMEGYFRGGLMERVIAIFDLIFGCHHSHLSRVFTMGGRSYRVCCDCGTKFKYSLASMCMEPRFRTVGRCGQEFL
jgi:hypothetical protein